MSKYKNIKNLNRFSDYFNALSHPHRLQIFLKLASHCRGKNCKTESGVGACVSDVGEGLNIAPSTLSHHIKELKRVGLIHVQRHGQQVGCWIEKDTIKELSDFFKELKA